ncbi:tetratricopeptide repeat protein [Streptomyces sp. NPDC091272]|uniref:tetratricopeptide repeat protein n=1 Tax=Streptomyces sp. NPDC091272 TaxID=3365981 RepID=UPI00382B3765
MDAMEPEPATDLVTETAAESPETGRRPERTQEQGQSLSLPLPPPDKAVPLRPASKLLDLSRLPRGRGVRKLSKPVRRAAIASVVAAAVAGGVLVALPRSGEEQKPAARPAAGAPGVASSLAALNARVRTNPLDHGAWSALGGALVERGARGADAAFYPKAEAALKRSLAVRPAARGNVAGMTAMAQLAHQRGDFAATKRWGESVRMQSPGSWAAYPLLIDAYGRLGDPKAAARTAEELMEKRGGATALGWTAQTYRDKGWREDAAALTSQAVALAGTPREKADELLRAAELAWERGDLSESLGFYDSALALDRRQGAAVAGRARVLAGLGRTPEAVKAYRTALALTPRPEYALELGELTEADGGNGEPQYGVARAQVAYDSRQGVRGNLVLGRLEADHGDADTAVELLREEWSRRHGPEVADALGWALHRAGDDEAALEYARKATKAGVRSALFSYHRGEIERAVGDYGAARRHLEEALRVNPVFSPLWAPRAQASLTRLGDPPEGGPASMWPSRPVSPPAQGPAGRSQEPRTAEPSPRKKR